MLTRDLLRARRSGGECRTRPTAHGRLERPWDRRVTSTASSPLVLHGRLGQRARLRSGELLLESGREVRRVPVAAIDRVEVRGRGGRRLAVVLTGPENGVPETYLLTSRSRIAVERFATVLSEALPVRDAAEPQVPGPRRVTVERRERRTRPGWRRILAVEPGTAVAAAFCLVMVALLVTGSWAGALCWLFVPLLGGAGVSLTSLGWKTARDGWVLVTRGITVDGRRKNSGSIDHGDTDALYVYLFTDTDGAPRAYRGSNGGRDEEEITYDPRDPGVSQLRRRTVAQLVAGLALLLVLVLPLLAGGVVLGLLAFADLFGFGFWSLGEF
ncbi:hypothetical protein [Streptomyces vilmorinianum]|uniref:hypothetical protein n=1 Tax=Streptomyces vilmorinianum TaxID=3051092 RepID=UPI0010FB96C5|nr:hypothetical protein [Streptomyces vilmorinianum]